MPALSQRSLDATLRHSVLLERLKAGEVRKVLPFLKEIDRKLRDRLSREPLSGLSRVRMERLLVEVRRMVIVVLSGYEKGLQKDLERLVIAEARFEANSLSRALRNPDFEAVVPAGNQVIAALTATPMSVRGASGGLLLKPFIRNWTNTQVEAVTGAIRRGAFEGQTNQQIIQTIRGTRTRGYRDGILALAQRQAEAVVRTSMAHVSSVGRSATFAANRDIVKEYAWVSTLDSRTTPICQSLDGRTFKVGSGPMPPAHVNCRSTTVPVLDERYSFLREGATRASTTGPVKAGETYYSWLQKQPASFQDAVLGKTRGKLLREGGLSAERFAKLRLSRNFEPLTLKEMQRLEPLAFEKANITLNPATGMPVKG